MIESKVVLVLGAGASVPYGFPDGPTLVRTIIDTPRSHEFVEHGRQRWEKREVIAFCEQLAGSHWLSIDRFLQRQPHLQQLGKALIAFHLLRVEHTGNVIPHPNHSDRWYHYLYNNMLAPDHPGALAENQLSVIT